MSKMRNYTVMNMETGMVRAERFADMDDAVKFAKILGAPWVATMDSNSTDDYDNNTSKVNVILNHGQANHMRTSKDPIVLTTDHAASSYGQPVLIIDGKAYGPADSFHGCTLQVMAEQDMNRALEPEWPYEPEIVKLWNKTVDARWAIAISSEL